MRGWNRKSAQRHTGVAGTSWPSLRSGLTAYVALSSGSEALLPPSPCGWIDVRTGWPPHRRKDLTPACGRQDHTILPYADRIGRMRDTLAHGCPPCEALRADAISVHRRPARVRDDRDTPLFLGPGCATHTSFPNFGKAEYFRWRGLTEGLGVLPARQRKGLWSRCRMECCSFGAAASKNAARLK